MPRRAKMKMKRTRRTSRATMEAMESTRDLTRLPMAFQYLEMRSEKEMVMNTHLVTLKALRRRIHLITERPTGGMT